MTQRAALRAILWCSSGVDLADHEALLAMHSVGWQQLPAGSIADILPWARAHMPENAALCFLLSTAWWSIQEDAPRRRLHDALSGFDGVILSGPPEQAIPDDIDPAVVGAWLDTPVGAPALHTVLLAILRMCALREKLRDTEQQLRQRLDEMQEVHRIGIALSAQSDLDALQQLILRTSRTMTNADAGTLYLLEEDGHGDQHLVFHLAQNDSCDAPYRRLVLPMDSRSLVGFVARSGQTLRLDDVYQLPPHAEQHFNADFDERFGYRTRSMLITPMLNHRKMVVGIIQLINRKRTFDVPLRDLADVEREVVPFTQDNETLLTSLASQAAVTLENNLLLDAVLGREQLLKRELQELRIGIDHAKQARQVDVITESEFFQDLRVKAIQMRAARVRRSDAGPEAATDGAP